jgi:hypothetical protein
MKLIRKGSAAALTTHFYSFDQNNSGGSYKYDERSGISVTVIVEATSWMHANAIAQSIGLYFDGSGDCVECCGYRWSEQWDAPGLTFEEALTEIADDMTCVWARKNMKKGEPEIFVHTLDGSLYGFWLGEEEDDIFLKNYLGGKVAQWQL